jgi:hypothetical protein
MINVPFIEFCREPQNTTHWIRVSSRRNDAAAKAVTKLSRCWSVEVLGPRTGGCGAQALEPSRRGVVQAMTTSEDGDQTFGEREDHD